MSFVGSSARAPWRALLNVVVLCIPTAAVAAPAAPELRASYRLAQRPAATTMEVGAMATPTFVDWIRYPAETRAWRYMTGATAYFRDVMIGGEIFVWGARDGDSWSAVATAADGGTLTSDSVVFHSLYQGYQNCFVSPYWAICGGTSLYIDWYVDSQCEPTGTWTMQFLQSSVPFYQGDFTVLPQVPPDAVPAVIDQLAYQATGEPYDDVCWWWTPGPWLDGLWPCWSTLCFDPPLLPRVCATNAGPAELWEYGCYVAASAMVFDYHGLRVDPVTLDRWFSANGGYSIRGTLKYQSIAAYAKAQGVALDFVDYIDTHDSPADKFRELSQAICKYGPQAIAVKGTTGVFHFLVAYGQPADLGTFYVLDSWGGHDTTLAAATNDNQFLDARIMSGPEYGYTLPSGIEIHFHSPGELVLTDPEGRRTGLDPLTGAALQEIPGSTYGIQRVSSIANEGRELEAKVLAVRDAPVGEWTLDVVGTADGYYSLDVTTYDSQLAAASGSVVNVPISVGTTHSYAFSRVEGAAGAVDLRGSFDGKGQRPVDVNLFLTYASPSAVTTTLPPDATSFGLMISYGSAILADTFRADLDGLDVSSLFAPAPGTRQLVMLPLRLGRNVLKLSVDGNVGKRSATDSDRLVFIVQ